jgi:D-alanine-D-alanine ligase
MMEAPAARRPPRRKPIQVAILFNVDYEDATPEGDIGYAARADVGNVAAAVRDALNDGAHEAHLVPVDGDLVSLRARLLELDPDVAFNMCESMCGDARLESAVPLLLDFLGIPFTGSPPEALSQALYKDRVKRCLEEAEVPTPRACVMRSANDPCDLEFPLIVKPVREDGSVGISHKSLVRNHDELRAQVTEITSALRQPVLVEQFIEGRELNVAMLGFPTARVLPLSEIDFSRLGPDAPTIVSYEAKWVEGSKDWDGTLPVTHPQLPNNVAARVRRVAVEAFRAVGLRDYGRVDIRLSQTGVPYVVDVNPNCDISEAAGMARSAGAVGIDWGTFLKLLVRYAMRRRNVVRVAGTARQALHRGGSPMKEIANDQRAEERSG